MLEVLLIAILLILVVIFFVVIIVGYRYLRYILNRHFFVIENIEHMRDLFIEYEHNLLELTRNPVVQTELNYKKVALNVEQIKALFSEFEEFYQNLPEKKEKNDE